MSFYKEITFVTFPCLSKSGDQGNWEILDDHNPNHKTKYYINVCRPVNQVGIGKGCATFAAACQSKFDQNGLTRGPNIPIQIGNCEQSIIWETEAACPLAIEETDTCTVKDPNSDYMFNLNPLKKMGDTDFYKVMNVANGKKNYRV
ncbi:insulin-like growth factor 2 receptor [Mytilus galloprovincialis]|uniref:Insulin-like growth factor 2 receptor n=1 Tax=Mytilus galloprovincialis TaxID=29158 RepID=A0A8B6GVY1_MYTGA|nr:insulin-like growth factor 2 receptor [Mytilus galloprovincialis]